MGALINVENRKWGAHFSELKLKGALMVSLKYNEKIH